MIVKVNVMNMPNKELGKGFLVARLVDTELWYYGFWSLSEEQKAYEVASELGDGIVLECGIDGK